VLVKRELDCQLRVADQAFVDVKWLQELENGLVLFPISELLNERDCDKNEDLSNF
jgi:hypothetical protein